MLKKIALAAALFGAASPLWAHEYTLGDLSITHPYAFETAPMAMSGGGYMTITNNGDTADRLVAVRADFPRVDIHQSVVTDGIGRMLPTDGIEIAPGETVVLQPGGHHVMFMGLHGRQFLEGEGIAAVLVFEQAGEIEVAFAVELRPGGTDADMPMDHGGMHMGDHHGTNGN